MGFETFTDLSALFASSMNNLMRQSIIQCTSGTRPSSPVEGMTIYQTDTDTLAVYNGSAWVEITPEGATVATLQTRNTASYGDLATVGPSVSLATGAKAIVIMTALLYNNSSFGVSYMGYAVSGATTIAAADTNALTHQNEDSASASLSKAMSFVDYIDSLTPGNNTFTAKYKPSAGISTFANRRLVVIPIP